MKKQIILLLNNNPPYSGVGRYAFELYKNLIKLEPNIKYISWDVELFDRAYNSLRYFKLEQIYYLLKFRLLSSSIKEEVQNCSLIHLTNAGYLATLIKKLRKKNKRIIITVHDSIPAKLRDSFGHHIAGRVITLSRLSDHIITVSEYTKKIISKILKVSHDRITVIYYGVDHNTFKPRNKLEARKKLNLPTDRAIILNVGSEEPRKNIPTLLKSFRKLLNDVPNAILIRVGLDNPNNRKLIRILGLNNKVLYCRASSNEIAYYYNAADILVHTAYYEDFGLPLVEAMASGLPVIACNRTATPEIVEDAGILLEPFDVDCFSYWMYKILTDMDLKTKLSEMGLKRSLNFSWSKCAKQTLDIYMKYL